MPTERNMERASDSVDMAYFLTSNKPDSRVFKNQLKRWFAAELDDAEAPLVEALTRCYDTGRRLACFTNQDPAEIPERVRLETMRELRAVNALLAKYPTEGDELSHRSADCGVTEEGDE